MQETYTFMNLAEQARQTARTVQMKNPVAASVFYMAGKHFDEMYGTNPAEFSPFDAGICWNKGMAHALELSRDMVNVLSDTELMAMSII